MFGIIREKYLGRQNGVIGVETVREDEPVTGN